MADVGVGRRMWESASGCGMADVGVGKRMWTLAGGARPRRDPAVTRCGGAGALLRSL
jgi:hypothetical protein